MVKEEIEIAVPRDILESWQEIVNIIAQLCEVPAALIMRLAYPDIEVFISSQSPGNPYQPGDKERFEDSGLYCETVQILGDKNRRLTDPRDAGIQPRL